MMHDPRETSSVRLNATGRFIAITKKLGLVARRADAKPADTPAPEPVTKKNPTVARPAGDPRKILMAVK
jgi:hypothetical protein